MFLIWSFKYDYIGREAGKLSDCAVNKEYNRQIEVFSVHFQTRSAKNVLEDNSEGDRLYIVFFLAKCLIEV